ncbi:MAG: hypothetical protein R2798_04005 [Chitinophagales bacterium]|nr:hypothetical protein [Bacteroidota bacterium]
MNKKEIGKEVIDQVVDKLPINFSERTSLIIILAVAAGIDVMLSGLELPWVVATLGGSIVIEEIVEYFISKFIAKNNAQIELTRMDKLLGWLPVPGVTAVSVACARALLRKPKVQKNELTVQR